MLEKKYFKIHQLVAMAFYGHVPCGYKKVVNHINHNKHDNRIENLEVINQRDNTNKKHIKSSSKYTGVSWHKKHKKWQSSILINNKSKYLGLFNSEIEASEYYQNAIKSIENGLEIIVKQPNFSSKYKGVTYIKKTKKWRARINISGKQKLIGMFKSEIEASTAYNNIVYNRKNQQP